ncbi:alpha/beta hydrolase [Enterococcus olivae]
MKKSKLFLSGLIGAGVGMYFLFRNQSEDIRIEEEIILDEHQELQKIKKEELFLVSSDHLPLALTVLRPAYRPVKAVVQIVHGILEHRKRYLEFAGFLAENGFAVVVSDNRGHGHSVDEQFPLGHMPGADRMVEDQYEITCFIKKRFPGKPVYLYGHSFGSILARIYLQKHDAAIDKLLLSGTVQHEKKAQFGLIVARIANKLAGERSFSWIMKKLSDFGSEDKSWLTNSKEHVAKAQKDPWMIPGYDNRGTMTIWEADHYLKKITDFDCQNPELPILSITGAEDLGITGGKKGLLDTENTLRAIGYRQVDMLDLPNMKHEVLNEIDNRLVYQLILDFFNS